MGTSHHSHEDGHGDGYGHDHDNSGHSHHHHSLKNTESAKQLKRVLVLTIAFMFVEAIGGYYTNSLALISDAIHMLTDTGAIALSLFAFFMSSRPATDSRTY